MQREVAFSGPVSEGWSDDDTWTVGGDDLNRPIHDLIGELVDGMGGEEGEVAFRADLYLSADGAGFQPATTGFVSGTVATLQEEEEAAQMHVTITLRGEIVYDPASSEYQIGASRIEQTVVRACGNLLGPFVGTPEAANLTVVLQIGDSSGWDDLPEAAPGGITHVVAVIDTAAADDGDTPGAV